MKKLNNLQLSRLKSKALELNKSHQIPFVLAREIFELKVDYDSKYVALVMTLTEKFLRVKGYYKKYPQEEQEATKVIKEILTKGVK